MKVTAKYSFMEEFLPPRCRKPRKREVEKSMNVNIKELTSEQAPIAMITTTWESRRVEGQADTVFGLTPTIYRCFNKRLYTPCISRSGDDIGTQYTISDVIWRINETGHPYNATEQERVKKIRSNAKRYVIIDGLLYEESGEPRYKILTFGLGHNHGGTGFFIETGYNRNIGKENYFNAFQREEAIEYFKKVALGRGDTDSVKEEKEINIEVLIPESVKCNPQKEHGDGCSFVNSLNAMINGSSSIVEAGLTAMAFGITQLSKA